MEGILWADIVMKAVQLHMKLYGEQLDFSGSMRGMAVEVLKRHGCQSGSGGSIRDMRFC